jgi:hypothetical protein
MPSAMLKKAVIKTVISFCGEFFNFCLLSFGQIFIHTQGAQTGETVKQTTVPAGTRGRAQQCSSTAGKFRKLKIPRFRGKYDPLLMEIDLFSQVLNF